MRRVGAANARSRTSPCSEPAYLIAGKSPHLPRPLSKTIPQCHSSGNPVNQAAGHTNEEKPSLALLALQHSPPASPRYKAVRRHQQAASMDCSCDCECTIAQRGSSVCEMQTTAGEDLCRRMNVPNVPNVPQWMELLYRVRVLVHRYDVRDRGQFAIENFSSWLYQQQLSPWCFRSSRGSAPPDF
jgi:hypothetical protein